MLLGLELPVSAAGRAARVWRRRERIEREAALLFDELGVALGACGHPQLAARATRAAADERRHALRCRALVEALAGPGTLDPERPRRLTLGPATLEPRDRALYAAVAIGCVTESLSCALLLELRSAATHPLVAETVDEILRDEIEHARIGWAVLAAEARARDLSWLGVHIGGMTAAAVADDVTPMAGDDELAGHGVLPRSRVRALVDETWAQVIAPGLAQHGLHA